MKIFLITILMMFVFLTYGHSPATAATARMIVKVIDEQSSVINNAHLNIRFSSDRKPISGITDENGFVAISGVSNDGVVLGGVRKQGFYESGFHHDFFVKKYGAWQPWNKEIVVVLRKIIDPVPMYVRNAWFQVPAVGKEFGFDLMKADWVIPYGQGTKNDFIFKIDRRYADVDDFDVNLTLTFTNEHDGIQLIKDDGGGDFSAGSRFRLPRTAPEVGYEASLTKRRSTSSLDFYANNPSDSNYIFRVRSEVDSDGKLKQAMYGKIRREIEISGIHTNTTKIRLFYYLNPDHTRNLEFDPMRNLFISLPRNEGVGLP